MRTMTTFDRPITVPETYHTLYLYYDLTESAKENAFHRYDNDDDATRYLDYEFEELHETARWFMEQTGCKLEFNDYSETWSSGESIYTGYDYAIKEFHPIDSWTMCYELDCMEAWNRHVSRLQYLAGRLIGCMEADYECAPNPYAHPDTWYEDRYQEELDSALDDVCAALNDAARGAWEYTFTREFYEDQMGVDDSEHWFTADGGLEFIRDASWTWCVDTAHDVDVIYECMSPMRLYVREYLD